MKLQLCGGSKQPWISLDVASTARPGCGLAASGALAWGSTDEHPPRPSLRRGQQAQRAQHRTQQGLGTYEAAHRKPPNSTMATSMCHRVLLGCLCLVRSIDALCDGGCCAPEWHTAYTLVPEDGCPGEWMPLTVPGLGNEAGLNVTICGRGKRPTLAQASAVLGEGWTYTHVRGSLTSFAMGSPDALRAEAWRGESTIDDAYMDGVGFARFTSQGREHVASYTAGLAFNARGYSFCAQHRRSL